MLEDIIGALDLVFAWENFFWAFIGVLCGAIMGSIPGLTDTMAIVLLLPFTYYLGPIPGIAMLMGLSKGGNFGGSLPAILFNIPGTPQAMCTTFDGYPLARQGKSGKAMQTALYSSVLADALSDLVLIFLAAPVAAIALRIGPPEYSMVVLFSLVVISVAATADPLRGLLSTALGLFLATVGTDPEFGTMRHCRFGRRIQPYAHGYWAIGLFGSAVAGGKLFPAAFGPEEKWGAGGKDHH